MKNAILLSALAATFAASTACSGEHQRNVLGPTDVVAIAPATSAGSQTQDQSMIGTWVSVEHYSTNAITALPPLSSCANFRWTITSQTATQASGNLSAQCPGDLAVVGTITGQLGGATIPLIWSGSASRAGESCSFTLNGVGHALGNDMFRIDYTGTSCLGPIRGSETLRLGSSTSSTPTPPATPSPSSWHVGPGPLSIERAQQVVLATSKEFPHLTAVFPSEQQAVAAADQLLARTVWHLQLAGFQAARQRNPSGLISSDKLSIFLGGAWHVYDIYSLGVAGRASKVQWIEVPLPNPVANPGIPD
jgi:hypothetical protein